jgi:hypothetical protein
MNEPSRHAPRSSMCRNPAMRGRRRYRRFGFFRQLLLKRDEFLQPIGVVLLSR